VADSLLTGLPRWGGMLAVGAHPDDESFGMGAVLAAFADAGTRIAVLSFTQGEASTLHDGADDLARIRADEFVAAGQMLGVEHAELLAYPDGGLTEHPLDELAEHISDSAGAMGVDGLLVFDEGGITGHPDHVRATEAALLAADRTGLPVLAWAIPASVATRLNGEFDTAFRGRAKRDLDILLNVHRDRQQLAIAEHHSQSVNNPVLWRRLELLGDSEWLRWLRPPPSSRRFAMRMKEPARLPG
jgi:N-acetylglucosamine malate deacetylase 2